MVTMFEPWFGPVWSFLHPSGLILRPLQSFDFESKTPWGTLALSPAVGSEVATFVPMLDSPSLGQNFNVLTDSSATILNPSLRWQEDTLQPPGENTPRTVQFVDILIDTTQFTASSRPTGLASLQDPTIWSRDVSDGQISLRYLPTRIFFPDTPDPAGNPVIVFSHGLGGGLAAANDLAQYWTDLGYIVIAPTHADSPTTAYDRNHTGLDIDNNGVVSIIEEWIFRADDLRIALSYLEQFTTETHTTLAGYTINPDQVVVAGHSYGATTSAFVSGGKAYDPTGFRSVERDDPRFQAVINLSGAGPEGALTWRDDSWDSIEEPFLRVTGTFDFSQETLDPSDRLEAVFGATPGSDRYAVHITDIDHSLLRSPGNQPTETDWALFQQSVGATTAFLQGVVGSDSAALATLQDLAVPAMALGTEGNDQWSGLGQADLFFGRAGNDSLAGNGGDDQLYGGSGQDFLQGGIGNDVLNGGSGADNLEGGLGDDVYLVDDNGEIVQDLWGANGGNDTVISTVSYLLGPGVENLILRGEQSLQGQGNRLDNILTGNEGNNQLLGLNGNDTLFGGQGEDSLVGGAGADRFVIGANPGQTRIEDFSLSEGDQLLLIPGEAIINIEYRNDFGRRSLDTIISLGQGSVVLVDQRIDADILLETMTSLAIPSLAGPSF